MIHPQPTAVLMLLWGTHARPARNDVESQEFVTAGLLDPSVNRARAFRALTRTQDARTAPPARRPRRFRRRGPVALRRRRRTRRPACHEQAPARSVR
jgi:hypothetical protein